MVVYLPTLVCRSSWRCCYRSTIRLYHYLTPAALVSRAIWTTHVDLSVVQPPRFLHVQPPQLTKSAEIDRSHPVASNTDIDQNLSVGDKILKAIGWMAGFYSRKAVLSRSALEIYKGSIDEIDYEAFFKALRLPDSLHSWFLIAQLHIWLWMVRLKREGPDGQYLIRQLVSTFWLDVKERPKALGVHSSALIAKSIREMSAEFNGLIIAYEEGLLLSDKVLAAAIWRNLIHDKSATDPVQLEVMVHYIRSQVSHMDIIDSEQLLSKGRATLLPFNPHVSLLS